MTRIGDVQSTLNTAAVNSDWNTASSVYHAPSKTRKNACRHGFRKAFKTSGGVKYSPRQFSVPTKYLTSVEQENELKNMNLLANGAGNYDSLYPTMVRMDQNMLAKSSATNAVMSKFDSAWLSQNDGLRLKVGFYGTTPDMTLDVSNDFGEMTPVWRYFGSMDGTFRLYPSTQVAQAYDPTQRSWFRQAIGDGSKTLVSTPYEDAFGMGYGALEKVLKTL